MSREESHSVRNGVLGTVIGGIVLAALAYTWPPLKSALTWLLDKIINFVGLFTDSYSVPGWALLLISLVALPTVIQLLSTLRRSEELAHANYVEDKMHGATWRWRWSDNSIANLWCFCPRCDAELVYNEASYGKTDFICENCNNSVVSSISGGDKSYALSAIQREIRRKVRTSQFPARGGAS